MDLSKFIGEKIKYYRNQNNWTQTELGNKIGAAKSTVANYEKGFRTPQQDTLFELADVFGISLNELFPDTRNSQNKYYDAIKEVVYELNDERKEKVFNYAKKQLEQQNNLVSNDSLEDDFLLAAHIDDNVTEEEMKEIKDFIQKVKDEHRNS